MFGRGRCATLAVSLTCVTVPAKAAGDGSRHIGPVHIGTSRSSPMVVNNRLRRNAGMSSLGVASLGVAALGAATAASLAATHPAAAAAAVKSIASIVTCATTSACVSGINTASGPGVSGTSAPEQASPASRRPRMACRGRPTRHRVSSEKRPRARPACWVRRTLQTGKCSRPASKVAPQIRATRSGSEC